MVRMSRRGVGRSLLMGMLGAAVWMGTATASTCVPERQVLLPASGEKITNVELVRRFDDRPVVLLGEHHDNVEHHRWQLQMITALHMEGGDVALGFEMFPRRMQPVLDRWVAGELSEKAFLEQVEWEKYWRFDADLYLPLFHYARMNGIPIHALNVDRALIREVGEKGWDDADPALKEGVGRPAPADEGYLLMLASVFSQHGDNHGKGEGEEVDEERLRQIMEMPMFRRFVQSQQVWDRAMAEAIAAALKERKPKHFIAIMGSGHLMNFHGVPHQLDDLGIERQAVFVPWDPEFDCELIGPDFADAVIGLKAFKRSDEAKKQRRPRLGIYLEPAEGGVGILRVVEGSVAEKAGIEPGDRIIAMAGQPVEKVQQVIDIVKGTAWGRWLPITVVRDGKEIEIVARFPPDPQR